MKSTFLLRCSRWLKAFNTEPSSIDNIFNGTWLCALSKISSMMPGLIHYNYNYQNSWPLRKLVCGLDIHNLHRKHEITFDHWNCILKLTWSWFPEHSHQRWNTAWCSFSSQTPCISCHNNTHLSHFSPRRMPWDLHKHYQTQQEPLLIFNNGKSPLEQHDTNDREHIEWEYEQYRSCAEYVSTFPFTSSNSTKPGHLSDSDSNKGKPASGWPLRMYLKKKIPC